MARFSASPLKALDRIYRFVGGLVGLKDFELEGGIQPVHDLSRQSEIDSPVGLQGFFSILETDIHAGSGTINTTHDPYGLAPTIAGLGPTDLGIWVMSMGVTVSVLSAFTIANASYVFPALLGAFPTDLEQYLFSFPDAIDQVTSGEAPLCGDLARVTNQVPLPYFMPFGGSLNFNTQVSAAATVITNVICWGGPLGTRPPGTA